MQREAGHPVLVFCTHGHSRSAIVVCAILIASGAAGTLEQARSKVQAARQGMHPNTRQWAALEAWHQRYNGGDAGGAEGDASA